MKQSDMTKRATNFLPLGQIEYEIFANRSSCGLSVFKDPVTFSEDLQSLARMHVDLRSTEYEESKQRFQAVEEALSRLEFALWNLHTSEIQQINDEGARLLSPPKCENTVNEPDIDELWNELNEGNSLTSECECQLYFNTLHQLLFAARKLASKRKRGRGRPPLISEQQTALEFVFLCHIAGWNLSVANSGSERKLEDLVLESDAVRCLAAVFHAVGKNPEDSIKQAKTMLRKIRKGQIYRPYPDKQTSYDESYLISFKNVTCL